MTKCTNCKKYLVSLNVKKHRMEHRCNAYPQFAIYGYMEDDAVINPGCNQYDPIVVKQTDRRSLKEKTLIRAGGTYNKENEKICFVCGKKLAYQYQYCNEHAPRDLQITRYHQKKYTRGHTKGDGTRVQTKDDGNGEK